MLNRQSAAPGPGNMGDAMAKIGQAVAMLQQAQMGLPPGSPQHKAVNHSIGQLSKHIPQGLPTAGNQMTFLRDLMRGLAKNFAMMQLQSNQGGQGGQPGGGGGTPDTGMQVAMGGGPQPMPSMPGA